MQEEAEEIISQEASLRDQKAYVASQSAHLICTQVSIHRSIIEPLGGTYLALRWLSDAIAQRRSNIVSMLSVFAHSTLANCLAAKQQVLRHDVQHKQDLTASRCSHQLQQLKLKACIELVQRHKDTSALGSV